MGRTKAFLNNSITTAMYQVVMIIVGLIIPKIMLVHYGSEINGLVTSITQFISYFTLVEAGLAGAAVYALYKPIADKNYGLMSRIIVATKKFYEKAGWIFVGLVILLAIIYPIFVSVENLAMYHIFFLVLVLGMKGAIDFFVLGKYRALLTADQKTYVISIASIIYAIVNLILVYILASLEVNIVILYLLSMTALFARSIMLMIYVKCNYKELDYKAEPLNSALDKKWDALYLQILGVVQVGAPVVLATIFTDLTLVSVYAIFNIVITGVNSLLSIFCSGLSASFGDVIARKQQEILQKSYSEFEFVYYQLITIVYAITFVMIMPFVNIYTQGITDANYNQPLIGFLMVLNGLLYNLKTPQGMLIISAGMYKETKWRTTIQALIIIVGGIILAPMWGLVGILIASCMSNIYRIIDLVIFVPKYITKLPIKNTIKRIIQLIIIITIVVIPCYTIDVVANNFYVWILYATGVGIYSLVVTGIIGIIFDKQELKNVLCRLKKLVIK